MHTNKIRTLGAVIAATAILAGCTTTTADPNTPSANSSSQAATSTPAPTPSSASSTPAPSSSTPSTRPPSSTPPPSTTPKPTTTTTSREPTSSSAPAPTTIQTEWTATVPSRWRGPQYDPLVTAAVIAYKGMEETWAQAQADPSAKDWTKEMSKYMADPALTSWAVKAYKPGVDNDLRVLGRRSATATVTNVVVKPGSNAVQAVRLRVCTDARNGVLLDSKGKIIPGPKNPQRGLSEFYVEHLSAGWRIRFLAGLTNTDKGQSC